MGLFDDVKYEAPCAKCGAILTDWQSKSGPRLWGTQVEPHQVRNFYTSCDTCKQWNEYDVFPQEVVLRDLLILRRVPNEDDL